MFEFLLALTAAVLVAGVVWAYQTTRDVLHPMMFLGPLFLYGTVLDPWQVRGDLDRFFPSVDDVNVVVLLDFLAVVGLVCGLLHRSRAAGPANRRMQRRPGISEGEGVALRRVATVLAVWALVTYFWGIANVGGFEAAFSKVKGGGRLASGYLSESMNLSLVAAVMAGLSRYRRGWTPSTLTLLAVGLVPNLLQGTFGGRRGPLFLALAAAMLSWFIARRRAPKFWVLWPSLAVAALAVVFIGSQRRFLHLGSDEGVRWEEFTGALSQQEADEGSNFIYGSAFVLTTRQADAFTWGREIAVNLLVRPVPKQLWPTKYADVGADWVTSNYPGLGNLTQSDWLATVGWLPLQGSSAISISDVYGEFSWGTVVIFYLIGRGFAALRRRRRQGGMWELLYLEALILSIYLATQSFSAFYHRYLILAIPTILVWKKLIEPRSRLVVRRPRAQYRGVSARSIPT